eukprot:4926966-Alexandrium_andersonii.AAC.1
MIANSNGGSGSFGWCDGSICIMHLGCLGNNTNYGVPGAVLKQLERHWLKKPPLGNADTGFQKFVKEMNACAIAGEQIFDKYQPEIIGHHATDYLAELIGDTVMGLKAGLEAPAGTKRGNARRYAAGESLRRLAKQDYDKARKVIKDFRVATGAGSNTMAQLYYWMDHGADEEYSYRYSSQDFSRAANDQELDESFMEWMDSVQDQWYGESLAHDYEFGLEAPRVKIERLSEFESTSAGPAPLVTETVKQSLLKPEEPTHLSQQQPALVTPAPPALHAPFKVRSPVPMMGDLDLSKPISAPAGLEGPRREIMITQ